jgi:hypothetical protein
MRLLFTTVVLLSFAGLSCAQANHPENVPLTLEEIIRRMIETHSVEGQMEKQISYMGDAVAVCVSRILADNALQTADIDMVLVILNSSFTDPSEIKVVADRQPRTTLMVLQYLEFWAKEPEVKKRIADTKKHIHERYAKYLRDSAS